MSNNFATKKEVIKWLIEISEEDAIMFGNLFRVWCRHRHRLGRGPTQVEAGHQSHLASQEFWNLNCPFIGLFFLEDNEAMSGPRRRGSATVDEEVILLRLAFIYSYTN